MKWSILAWFSDFLMRLFDSLRGSGRTQDRIRDRVPLSVEFSNNLYSVVKEPKGAGTTPRFSGRADCLLQIQGKYNEAGSREREAGRKPPQVHNPPIA
jgi:hypothetical protein